MGLGYEHRVGCVKLFENFAVFLDVFVEQGTSALNSEIKVHHMEVSSISTLRPAGGCLNKFHTMVSSLVSQMSLATTIGCDPNSFGKCVFKNLRLKKSGLDCFVVLHQVNET